MRYSKEKFLILYIKALLFEGAFLKEIYPNFHRVSNDVWRSAQPTPRLLRKWIKNNKIRTILCLRSQRSGDRLMELEKRICEQEGVEMVYFKLSSRDIPEVVALRELHKLFGQIKYPLLIHCKAGADRAGLASTLYLHWYDNLPLSDINQLKFIPYLHFKSGKTGLIDYFFESYEKEVVDNPCDLLLWAETRMDRSKMKKDFKPTAWGKLMVEFLLNRE